MSHRLAHAAVAATVATTLIAMTGLFGALVFAAVRLGQ